MKIHIIRHGDPNYEIDSLTPKGWKEAEHLSERLLKMPIDDYYCSPLGRARDTAKPTIEKNGKKIEVLHILRVGTQKQTSVDAFQPRFVF